MGRQKVIKNKAGVQREETKNFIEDILNDPKDFDPKTFKTHSIDDNTKVVYGNRKSDGRTIIHKIQTRKK